MLESNPRTCFLFCQCQSLLYSSQDPLNSLLSTTCFTHHYWFFIDLKSPPLPPPLVLPTIQIASAPLQGEKEAWAWHWFLHRLFSSPILYFCFGHWPLVHSFFCLSLFCALSLFFSVSQCCLNVSWTSQKLLDCRNCGKYCPRWFIYPQLVQVSAVICFKVTLYVKNVCDGSSVLVFLPNRLKAEVEPQKALVHKNPQEQRRRI